MIISAGGQDCVSLIFKAYMAVKHLKGKSVSENKGKWQSTLWKKEFTFFFSFIKLVSWCLLFLLKVKNQDEFHTTLTTLLPLRKYQGLAASIYVWLHIKSIYVYDIASPISTKWFLLSSTENIVEYFSGALCDFVWKLNVKFDEQISSSGAVFRIWQSFSLHPLGGVGLDNFVL